MHLDARRPRVGVFSTGSIILHWSSLLPPLLALALALLTRRIVISLSLGLFLAVALLEDLQALASLQAFILRLWQTITAPGNREVLGFSLLVGGLLALIRTSGGVGAFVAALNRRRLVNTPRQTLLGTSLLGVLIFMETNLSLLVSGLFAAPLFDRFRLSRARLAWIIDSTCSPVSVLILLNGWGVYLYGLLQGYGLDNVIATLAGSLLFNFYPWLALGTVLVSSATGKVWLSLADHESTLLHPVQAELDTGNSRHQWFWQPLLVMIGTILVFMMVSGRGRITNGNGPVAILVGILCACAFLWLTLLASGRFSPQLLLKSFNRGLQQITPLVTIVLMAFALGSTLRELGTGDYVSSLIKDSVSGMWLPLIIFIASAFMSFCTGTSWGTFALMIPVAIPMATSIGLPPSLLLGAILSGGVWGDHCSPISDSTLLASLASGCDHLTHVRTQLPIALATGTVAMALFVLTGFVLQG